MPQLIQLGRDLDSTCRSKALLALSGLVRHYVAGLDAFRQQGGLQLLLGLLGAEDPRVQRKVGGRAGWRAGGRGVGWVGGAVLRCGVVV